MVLERLAMDFDHRGETGSARVDAGTVAGVAGLLSGAWKIWVLVFPRSTEFTKPLNTPADRSCRREGDGLKYMLSSNP